jgi:hypothetical protein
MPAMLQALFAHLSRAVEGGPALALSAAFVWGILSIVLSPCHLASIPLIVGFIDEQGRISTRRAFQISLLFSLGILITIGLIGAATAAAGRMLGDIGAGGNYLVAVIFLLVGLHLLGAIPLPFTGPGQVKLKRRGRLAAFLIGLLFGIALGPAPSPTWPPCWPSPSNLPPTGWPSESCCLLPTASATAPSSSSPATSPKPSALFGLERILPWRAHPQENLRRAGCPRRPLDDLHRISHEPFSLYILGFLPNGHPCPFVVQSRIPRGAKP